MAQVIVPNVGQKDDALTTIMKGLSIASNIYGIRTNMAQLDEFQKKQAKEDAMAQGKYDKDQQLMLSKDFNVSADKPKAGNFQTIYDSQSGTPLYASVKASKQEISPIIKEIKGMKDGVAGTVVKDYRSGKELDFIPEASNQGKQPSKEQFDAAIYGKRLDAANNIFDTLEAQGYQRNSPRSALAAAIIPDALASSEYKQQEQAERNFINAVLRRESGSAINATEFASGEKQYFPRAGDTPEVLEQKRQNRLQASAGFQAAAGNAWDQVPTVAKRDIKKSGSSVFETLNAAPSTPSAPKAGAVENGYIFQGGDPANPKSWKKQ